MKFIKKIWRFRLLILGAVLLAAAMAVSVQGSFGGFDVEVGPGGFDSEFSGWDEEEGAVSGSSGSDTSEEGYNAGNGSWNTDSEQESTNGTGTDQNSETSGNTGSSSNPAGDGVYVADDWGFSAPSDTEKERRTANQSTVSSGNSNTGDSTSADDTGNGNSASGQNYSANNSRAGNLYAEHTVTLTPVPTPTPASMPTPIPTPISTLTPTPTPCLTPLPSAETDRTKMADILSKDNMAEIPGTTDVFPEADCLHPVSLLYWQDTVPPGQLVFKIDEDKISGIFLLRINHKEAEWKKKGNSILVQVPDGQAENQIELIAAGFFPWTNMENNVILSSSSR